MKCYFKTKREAVERLFVAETTGEDVQVYDITETITDRKHKEAIDALKHDKGVLVIEDTGERPCLTTFERLKNREETRQYTDLVGFLFVPVMGRDIQLEQTRFVWRYLNRYGGTVQSAFDYFDFKRHDICPLCKMVESACKKKESAYQTYSQMRVKDAMIYAGEIYDSIHELKDVK